MKLTKEVKVGLLAVIAGVILYFGVNFLKGSDIFSSDNTYYVVYDEVDGLTVSNPVWVNGLSVGRVNRIKILQDENYHILVELQVKKDIQLGDSTVAFLSASDILGSKAIVLDVGKVRSVKQDGDTLIGKNKEGITDILAQKAVPLAERVDTVVQHVNNILGVLSDNSDAIQNTTDNLYEISLEVKQMTKENRRNLNDVIVNLREVSAALNDPQQGIRPLMTKLNTMADSLNQLEINKVLTSTEQTVNELQAILLEINKGEGSLGKFLKNDSLYINLNRSAEDLDKLLEDIRKNPKKYVNFSLISF